MTKPNPTQPPGPATVAHKWLPVHCYLCGAPHAPAEWRPKGGHSSDCIVEICEACDSIEESHALLEAIFDRVEAEMREGHFRPAWRLSRHMLTVEERWTAHEEAGRPAPLWPEAAAPPEPSRPAPPQAPPPAPQTDRQAGEAA